MAKKAKSKRTAHRNDGLIDDERRPVDLTPLERWEATAPPPLHYDDYDPIQTPRQQKMAIREMKRQETALHGVIHTDAQPMKTKRSSFRDRAIVDVIEPPVGKRYQRDYSPGAFVASKTDTKRESLVDTLLGCKKKPKRKKKGSGAGRKFVPWCK